MILPIFSLSVVLSVSLLFHSVPVTGSFLSPSLKNNTEIYFSKHAVCRMECRQIRTTDVEQVLQTGIVNLKRSSNVATTQLILFASQIPYQYRDCVSRYSLEQFIKSRNIRIVISACHNRCFVITCIDLENYWPCGVC